MKTRTIAADAGQRHRRAVVRRAGSISIGSVCTVPRCWCCSASFWPSGDTSAMASRIGVSHARGGLLGILGGFLRRLA